MSARHPTISNAYLEQQQKLHEDPNYGVASRLLAPVVKEVIRMFPVKSVSDYGAGKKNLLSALNELGVTDLAYFPYDPAFPEYGAPVPADMVCCIDVLEHVEPDYLNVVLSELSSLVEKFGFFSIHTTQAMKTLPDGRNAHLIQNPSSWWLPRLCEYFEILHLARLPDGFWVIVEPKTAST